MFSHLKLSLLQLKTSLVSDQAEATRFRVTWGLQDTSQSLEQQYQLILQNVEQLLQPKLQKLQLREQMGPTHFKRVLP